MTIAPAVDKTIILTSACIAISSITVIIFTFIAYHYYYCLLSFISNTTFSLYYLVIFLDLLPLFLSISTPLHISEACRSLNESRLYDALFRRANVQCSKGYAALIGSYLNNVGFLVCFGNIARG